MYISTATMVSLLTNNDDNGKKSWSQKFNPLYSLAIVQWVCEAYNVCRESSSIHLFSFKLWIVLLYCLDLFIFYKELVFMSTLCTRLGEDRVFTCTFSYVLWLNLYMLVLKVKAFPNVLVSYLPSVLVQAVFSQ